MKLSLNFVILAAAVTGALAAPRRLQARDFEVREHVFFDSVARVDLLM